MHYGQGNGIHSYRDRAFQEYEHKCSVCGWNEDENILEVHHIKGILEFDKTATIEEINDEKNLIWLCPNHHKMLEMGLIELDLQ